EQRRAFTHISDVAPIIADCVNIPAARNEIFNVGADVPFTVSQLAEAVAAVMGGVCTVKHLAPRNEVKTAFSDHSKADAVFGIRKKTSLESGLQKMAEWVKAHGARSSGVFENIEITKNLPKVWAEAAGKVGCYR